MTRKADRFERQLSKQARFTDCGIAGLFGEKEVARFLRNEHAWFRRMVMKERREMEALAAKTNKSTDPRDKLIVDCLRSRAVQCTDILTRLTQRRR